ncbi:MAG TPA: chemotaxis protein CheB [Polyangia bacterium]|jgi:two-component system chemotaxis response regulator CheB|nr:chemotaxis protein CheB [Polyangia bacterium]
MSAAPSPKIVVIGTSLGGLRALEIVLRGLAPDFPLPVAVVQHRSAEAEGNQSRLARLLQPHSPLPVVEANDKDPLVGGRVYLAPPDYHLLVDDGGLALSVDARVSHARPSIDVLFESAADVYREGVLAVVMTGASADGTVGALRIKQRGGVIVAQDPRTAESPIMPQSVISAGVVDHVLPLDEIAAYLNVAAVTRR